MATRTETTTYFETVLLAGLSEGGEEVDEPHTIRLIRTTEVKVFAANGNRLWQQGSKDRSVVADMNLSEASKLLESLASDICYIARSAEARALELSTNTAKESV